jgi:hypothetical protein
MLSESRMTTRRVNQSGRWSTTKDRLAGRRSASIEGQRCASESIDDGPGGESASPLTRPWPRAGSASRGWHHEAPQMWQLVNGMKTGPADTSGSFPRGPGSREIGGGAPQEPKSHETLHGRGSSTGVPPNCEGWAWGSKICHLPGPGPELSAAGRRSRGRDDETPRRGSTSSWIKSGPGGEKHEPSSEALASEHQRERRRSRNHETP